MDNYLVRQKERPVGPDVVMKTLQSLMTDNGDSGGF